MNSGPKTIKAEGDNFFKNFRDEVEIWRKILRLSRGWGGGGAKIGI